MSDTGYNHKYVYILGQGPVFELLGYFIRRKLRCVNKWLNEYVSTDIEDRAQRLIRLAFMRVKVYRAMCLSCWPITRLQFRDFLNNKDHGDELSGHFANGSDLRSIVFLTSNAVVTDNMPTISRYTRTQIDRGIKPCANLFSSPCAHSFAQSALKVPPYGGNNHEYYINRIHDTVLYLSLRVLGGVNRKFLLKVNASNYIKHCINDETVSLRIFINIPIVAVQLSTLSYAITGCERSKALQFGSFADDTLRIPLVRSIYENKHHKFFVEEYDCTGALLNKQDYYKSALVKNGILCIDEQGTQINFPY